MTMYETELEQQDERDLVVLAKTGNQPAFAELQRRTFRKIYGLAYRMRGCLSVEQVNDVVQDVYLAAFRGLPTFAGRCKFTTWLHSIARNLLLQNLKQERYRQAKCSYLEVGDFGKYLADGGSISQVESRLDKNNFLALVWSLFKTLPTSQRQALGMYLKGLRYAEIARLTLKNEEVIKGLIHRARVNLKRRLGGLYENRES